ncbi:MAG: RNA polymerase sigma factor [Chloroflexota bacterium]
MASRTNDDWLRALKRPGVAHDQALQELRDYLLRAVLVYLRDHRSDLSNYAPADLHQLAEDLAQEALVSIQDNLDTFRSESKFTTWAYRCVINLAVSELRLQRYRSFSLERLPNQETAALMAVIENTSSADPERAAEQRDFLRTLRRIIQTELTERQRQAIVAVHFQGQPMSAVAHELNISVNVLYKLLHDARQKLKARLEAAHLSESDVLAIFEIDW